MKSRRHSTVWWVIWCCAIVLFVVHQDFWYWNDRSLVFGFLPIGLAYHVGFSIAAALLWLMAVKFAWPTHIEEWADRNDAASQPRSEGRE